MSCLNDLEILALEQVRNQVINLFARNHLRVYEEELEVNWCITVLVEKEVAIWIKQLWDLKRLQAVDKAILELEMDRCWELALFVCTLDYGLVLLRLQVIEATGASCVHHHLIKLHLWIRCGKHNGLVFEILGVAFILFLTHHSGNRVLLSSWHVIAFLALARHDSC